MASPALSHEYYEGLAREIIRYLSSRYHTEVPHIGILSPESPNILRWVFNPQTTLLDYEESEELDESELAEQLDPMRLRGNSTFGVRATFRDYRENSLLKFCVQFYYRIAPPVEFRRAVICITVHGLRDIEVTVDVFDDQDRPVLSRSVHHELQNKNVVVISVGLRDVAGRIAERISGVLYNNNALLINLNDEEVVRAFSTASTTRNGNEFCFVGRLQQGGGRSACGINSSRYYAVQNFLVEVRLDPRSDDSLEATFILRYIAPALVDVATRRLVQLTGAGYPSYIYIGDRRNRWSICNLLEVEGKLEWYNCRSGWSWRRSVGTREVAGLHNLVPIGCLAVEESGGLILRDWHVAGERVPELRRAENPLEVSFERAVEYAVESSNGLIDEQSLREGAQIVLQAIRRVYNIDYLYEFQENSLREGLSALAAQQHRVIVLQARTAGGKTLAFLLPLLVWTVAQKIRMEHKDKVGVKVLLFYPTIALQNDQATTLFRILWQINRSLWENKKPLVTLGMLHAYIEYRRANRTATSRADVELRLGCPECGSRLIIRWEPIRDSPGVFMEKIVCSRQGCRLSDPETVEGQILQRMVKATREAVYSDPPDFLIVTPDIINARLTLAAKEDPAALSILGKRVYVCGRCGWPHDTVRPPRKCSSCGCEDIKELNPSHPNAIVIDEAHLLRGAFGAQVSHVFTRLEQAIRAIKSLPDSWRPVYFVSSATLNNPEARACELLETDRSSVSVIQAEPLGEAEPRYRVHAFVMPKVFSPEATTARIMESLYDEARALEESVRGVLNDSIRMFREAVFGGRFPATLVFVNRISEANDLVNQIRQFVPRNVRVNGHTTDFESERARIEDEFSRGQLEVLVATRGLEVGVDFDRVDIGVIYGMPFYISDYTQRIGRIGRNRHCIIFNIFMPDKAIDYFYHMNWRLLCDGDLRDIHMRNEAYRIERRNPEVVRRSAQRAVLDLISVQHSAGRIISTSISQNQRILQQIEAILRGVGSYVLLALRLQDPTVANVAREFARALCDQLNIHGTLLNALRRWGSREINALRSLRSIEHEVEYQFPEIIRSNREIGRRTRDLMYAFRHSMPSQIISYRGLYFAVNMVDGRDLRIGDLEG